MNTFISIVGILLLVAGVVGTVISVTMKKQVIRKLGIAGLIVGLVFILIGSAFVIIPTGYTGVRTTFGQVSNESVPKGFNWKIPFVQKIELVNNKQQDVLVNAEVWGETIEKTPVFASDTVITYQISEARSPWIFANVTNHNNHIDD